MNRFHSISRREYDPVHGVQEANVFPSCHDGLPATPAITARGFKRPSCVVIAILMFLPMVEQSLCFAQDSPLNPNYCAIQPFGTMDAWLTKGGNQVYGQFINAVGDVNGDGLADWIVVHNRIDTSFESETARELLLYHGIPRGLPSPQSGQRIGPEEIGSASKFLCAGDYDGDHNMDLVISIQLFSDTLDGKGRYNARWIVVYWGNESGAYSNNDTSHLLNPGEYWLSIYAGYTISGSNERPDGMIIWGNSTVNGGSLIKTAMMHLFALPSGHRWGRDGESRLSVWQWWYPPLGDKMQIVDHDGDGNVDFVTIHQDQVDSVMVGTIYGDSSGYFDTTSTETISLQRANGRVAEMLDITGDSIPDLVVNAGSQELIKIFIGRRGHRLKEQYGTGIDPPDVAGGRPFARPWAQILLPHSVDTTWRRMGFERLWDFGDVGNDGIADVVVSAIFEDMYVYSTGEYSDSYLDAALVTLRSVQPYAARLGDIDGSGRDAIAIRYSTPPGGIAFYHTNGCVEDAGGNEVPLPPGTGRPTTSVEDQRSRAVTGAGTDLHLAIMPNPSANTVELRWSMRGAARVCVYDALGNECGRWMTSGNEIELDLSGWPRGGYLITVQTRSGVASEHLVLR